MCQISINFDFGTKWGVAIGKYLIKKHFWHQNQDVHIWNIECAKFQ